MKRTLSILGLVFAFVVMPASTASAGGALIADLVPPDPDTDLIQCNGLKPPFCETEGDGDAVASKVFLAIAVEDLLENQDYGVFLNDGPSDECTGQVGGFRTDDNGDAAAVFAPVRAKVEQFVDVCRDSGVQILSGELEKVRDRMRPDR